jgi:hypothetical protein
MAGTKGHPKRLAIEERVDKLLSSKKARKQGVVVKKRTDLPAHLTQESLRGELNRRGHMLIASNDHYVIICHRDDIVIYG